MNSELRRTFSYGSNWQKSSYQYTREGIGKFGQTVHQTARVIVDNAGPKVQSYGITETFDNLRRVTLVSPSWDNPSRLIRYVRLDVVYPGNNAAASVNFSHTTNSLNVEFGQFAGPVDRVVVTIENAPLSLRYRKKALVKATMQGDYVSPYDNLYPKEPMEWDKALDTALTMAQTEDPRSLQIDKKLAQRDLNDLIQARFDPDGESVKVAKSYAERVKQFTIAHLIAKYPAIAKIYDQLPLNEWVAYSLLFSVEGARNRGEDLTEALERFDPTHYLRINAERLIGDLTAHSRRRTMRHLIVTGFTNTEFNWKDRESEDRNIIVDKVDEATKTTQPERQLRRFEEVKRFGELPYGESVAVLDHQFIIDRGSIECVARGRLKWAVSRIPLYLPVEDIRKNIETLTTDPTQIPALLGLKPLFL